MLARGNEVEKFFRKPNCKEASLIIKKFKNPFINRFMEDFI